MSAARVPLLMGNKGRKPTRSLVVPRSRPSNVDRMGKRPEATAIEAQSNHTATVANPSELEAITTDVQAPSVPYGITISSTASNRLSSGIMRSPILVSSKGLVSGRPTPPNPDDSTRFHPSPALKSSRTAVTTAGAIALEQQHQQQLASHNSSPNPLLQRVARKLDIKPHQSPRRVALQQQQQLVTSPFVLAASSSTSDIPSISNVMDTEEKTVRQRPRRHVKNSEESKDESEPTSVVVNTSTPRLPTLSKSKTGKIYVPAREQATLWAKQVLQRKKGKRAQNEGETVSTSSNKRKRSDSMASSTASSIVRRWSGRSKENALSNKDPTKMTMGEFAKTIPLGRRKEGHEQEEQEDSGSSFPSMGISRMTDPDGMSQSTTGTTIVTPQVQLVDGKMVILESTVQVAVMEDEEDAERPRQQSARPTRYIATKGRGIKRWTREETKQFYYCLSQVGPNFEMMATLFPSRTRGELKTKFKNEDKHHRDLVEVALQASFAPLDSEIIDVMTQVIENDARKKDRKRRVINEQEERREDVELSTQMTLSLTQETLLSESQPLYNSQTIPEEGEKEEEEDHEVEHRYSSYYGRERAESFDFES